MEPWKLEFKKIKKKSSRLDTPFGSTMIDMEWHLDEYKMKL